MRKLGDYENDDLNVGPSKFTSLYAKYEPDTRLRNNPANFLNRHQEEGEYYRLSERLERVVRELAARVHLTL